MNVNKGLRNFAVVYYCIGLYINAYFYLTWSAFESTLLFWILRFVAQSGVFLLVLIALLERRILFKLSYRLLGIIVWGVVLTVYIIFSGEVWFVISDYYLLLNIVMLLLVDAELRADIFNTSMKIFAIAVLPSLIYYVFSLIGIDFPHTSLYGDHVGKNAMGVYYLHYPFGLTISSPGGLPRYCGVFDEPGVVGTLAGLFFAATYEMQGKKKWYILLLVEGLLSFSLAFYVLLVIFIIVHAFLRGAFKFAGVMLTMALALTIFMNVDTGNEYIEQVKNRIDFSSAILVKDNRTGASFEKKYEEFLEEGGATLVFGKGRGATNRDRAMSGAFSYKCVVYDYGILGAILYFGFFIFVAFCFGIKYKCIPFVVLFTASLYQRPYVFTMEYVSLYIAAVSTLDYLAMAEHASSSKEQLAWTNEGPRMC